MKSDHGRLGPPLLEPLAAIVGREHGLTDPDQQLPYLREWRAAPSPPNMASMKREALRRARSGVELELMRASKTAFDPNGILNPGKVLWAACRRPRVRAAVDRRAYCSYTNDIKPRAEAARGTRRGSQGCGPP